MYTKIVNSTLIVSCLVIFTVNVFAKPVEPVRTLDLPYVCSGYITLDGLKEDEYSDMQDTHLGRAEDLPEEEFSANFAVCTDFYYLYIYAEFTDDIEHSYTWGVGDAWLFDNFEVYLQLDTNTVRTTYDTTTIQLRICRGLDSVQTPGRAARSEFLYYMEPQAPGGWIAEVAIPWTSVLPKSYSLEDILSYAGKPIGFDFSARDSDGAGPVGEAQGWSVYWDLDGQDGTEGTAWEDASTFGYITLPNVTYPHPCTNALPGNESENAETQGQHKLVVSPNPSTHSIEIQGLKKEVNLLIYNMQGKELIRTLYSPNDQLDVSGLESGVYIARFENGESLRFVKE